jgi:rare lipoprotein A
MRTFPALIAVLLLTACSSSGSVPSDITQPSGGKGAFKIGRPYQIAGQWYKPQVDWTYDQTGIASWYGLPFHGKATANGEVYNKFSMTAAHKTLQLPSIVRVTNLENNKSIIVRINDRGPFVGNRIIDLSYAAAQTLDLDIKGTARVRVQVLPDESRRVALALGARPEQLRQGTSLAAVAPINKKTATKLASNRSQSIVAVVATE